MNQMSNDMNANILIEMILMILASIIISYLLLSNVMLTFKNGVYSHINKLYMSLFMGFTMGIIMVIIMLILGYTDTYLIILLIIFTIATIILIILIRGQVSITDREFAKSMIEHHDMAIFMASKVLDKSTNEKIRELATNIVDTQQKEINDMKLWLDSNLI